MSAMRAAGAAALALLATAAHAQDPALPVPRFTVNVDAVNLDVLVTDRGRPVSDLSIADFAVRDNGVAQQIVSVTHEDRPVDLFFVIDRSYSVTGKPLDSLREAARMLLDELGAEDRAALLTFSHSLHMAVPLSADRSAMRAALDALRPAGATSLSDAVYTALLLREGTPNRAMVLVFSDGRDSSSWMPASAVLDLARQTDVVVYGITLQADRPSAPPPPVLRGRAGAVMIAAPPPPADGHADSASVFLEEIAAASGGQLFQTDNPGRLRELFLEALRDMKARYTVSYVPQGVDRKGWHAIDVTLTRRRGDVTARAGYLVP